ncbi:hypothetical protein TWF696_003675 [Orbilia brochopaga]|uniref:WW domain-containing protein n=1 Tax=Orbilia brochopaga TaxID=3140254 RepID=A0AAV9V3T8_9PEZI
MTANAPLSHADAGHRDAEVDAATLVKPLARSRSPTQSPDGRSRKRHRPDSPSLQSHQQTPAAEPEPTSSTSTSTSTSTSSSDDAAAVVSQDGERKEDDSKPQSSERSQDVTPKPQTETADGEGDTAETEQEEGELPPLPPGPPPEEPPSDGWEAVWEPEVGQYYFYNHLTGETTWTNPRVPPSEAAMAVAPAAVPFDQSGSTTDSGDAKQYSGYVPAIHGDYDPTAPYAQQPERTPSPTIDPYVAHAAFNRFTGRFQNGPGTEQQTEESRARRQMEIYFDVDAAANCHDGRSLKAERQAKKLTKKEVKAFREKTRLKKEEKKRAWLRD